jgi:hypothetical protein
MMRSPALPVFFACLAMSVSESRWHCYRIIGLADCPGLRGQKNAADGPNIRRN